MRLKGTKKRKKYKEEKEKEKQKEKEKENIIDSTPKKGKDLGQAKSFRISSKEVNDSGKKNKKKCC